MYVLHTELEEELECLLNTGCIEPSTSPYFSGVVLKELLTHVLMLHPPDQSKPFFLSTDASKRGFGAVLEQEGEDKYSIAYASRQTNPAEQKYAPMELGVA